MALCALLPNRSPTTLSSTSLTLSKVRTHSKRGGFSGGVNVTFYLLLQLVYASHIVVNIQIHSCVVHKPLEQTLNR